MNGIILELFTATGCALILVGTAMIHLPAAFIVAGLMLIAIAYARLDHHQGEP